ncbi:hypothetical protein V494_03816 [Pseudogymnoascus sp. VKM F-4513 (FW-928)]|nr:hypothetical protein V494_03816 [Pseudogymnoascus sp. VKM F-4513 (FW-928)]
MASIVYDGVAGGGDLFQGQKFFIALRVPQRVELVKNVERNGGVVVRTEKDADVLIADHAKPTLAPANSFSWKYLEQSMKKGQLEDLESHRIGSTSSPRKTGLPMKLTRTPFTGADDMAIRIWVAKAELKGLSVKGNEIYQQFAEKNPRHTAQSWRDRYIKHLSNLAPPEIDMNSTDWPVKNKENRMRRAVPPATQSKNAPTAPKGSGAGKHRGQAGSSLPAASSPLQDETPFTDEGPLTKGMELTEDDIKLLEEEHPSILNIPPGSEVFAWIAFAKKHPWHSSGDWCNIYHNVFKERKLRESQDKDSISLDPKSNKGKDPVSKTYTTPVRAAAPSRSGTESIDPSRRRKPSEDEATASRSLGSETPDYQPPISAAAHKAKFIGNLGLFLSSKNRAFEDTFDLDGRKLELYDLWNVVNKPEFGGFRRVEKANKWLQVAVKLGINTYRHETADTALRQVYCDKLVECDTYWSEERNRDAKRRTSPTSTGPVTPIAAIPTQVEDSRVYCSLRKGGETRGHTSLTKSTEPVTPVTAIRKQTPEHGHILSSGASNPNALRSNTVLPQESAITKVAAQRIRQSLGHGELAFLQSLTEFSRGFFDEPVVFEPVVSGHKIRLFYVWTASLPLLGHFDEIKDSEVWEDLATKLGFETSAHPNAPNELKKICNDFLADYYDFFLQVEQERLKEGALRQQSKGQGQPKVAADDSDDNLESPSLAFRTAAPERQKRSHDEDIHPVVESRPTSSNSRNKRPRTTKGKERADEIPSTPEHIYNSHLSSDGQISGNQNASKKLIETNIEYFSPPSPSEEADSSPSRQLWSEAIDYTPPSQNNNDEEATQSQTDSQCHEKIDEFLASFGAKGFGHEIIVKALSATTMDTEIAEWLLSDPANRLEIPMDVAGVWTEEDDNAVKSHRQSGGYKRTLKKHGEARCFQRKEYLRSLAEVENS